MHYSQYAQDPYQYSVSNSTKMIYNLKNEV